MHFFKYMNQISIQEYMAVDVDLRNSAKTVIFIELWFLYLAIQFSKSSRNFLKRV